ncbi:thioredoxin family protein [Salipaludibacillus sp. HK11]|uniref:thioredoxin family protein n=1 Tax=Salipaludibacillus sp. HK11 TaxID=3394320 RepID=UPI0039FD3A64
MKRVNSREILINKIETDATLWVFLYAPMCGTCEIARSFITMVEKVKEIEFVCEMDLNLAKDQAREWEIESVPCLVEFSHGEIQQKLYAFESVSTVFEFINHQKLVKKGDQ